MKKGLNTCDEDHNPIWFEEEDCPLCIVRDKAQDLIEQIDELNDELHYYKAKNVKLKERLWNPHCLFIEGKFKF